MIEALSTVSVAGKDALDMGTGSGVLGLICAQSGGHVTVTDVDNLALENVQIVASELNLNIRALNSDIFSNITDSFDVVLFNPPYLPSDKITDRTVDGGLGGRLFLDQFLNDLSPHLKTDGFAMLLVSSLNNPQSIRDAHPETSFEVVAERNLFFEKIQVLLCRTRCPSR
jgi:release factor glutamine methyltransferase